MTEWQPIETAPKDGTPVLLWPFAPQDFWAGYAPQEVCLGFNALDEGWFNPEQRCAFEPTHWMPLPAPPHEGDKE